MHQPGQNANGLKGERYWAKKKGRVDVLPKDGLAELTVCILLPSLLFLKSLLVRAKSFS